jgi:crooked neck
LYTAYTKFEKQHGTVNTIENTVLQKRRIQCEEATCDSPDYDAWFDYIRLEESVWHDCNDEGTVSEKQAAAERVREVYERAVAQVPLGGEKSHWRRYIFLWLDYALFEEIETKVFSFILILHGVAEVRCRTIHVQGKYIRRLYSLSHTNSSR